MGEIAGGREAEVGGVNAADCEGLGCEFVDGAHGLDLIEEESQLKAGGEEGDERARRTFNGIVMQLPSAVGSPISRFHTLSSVSSELQLTETNLYLGRPLRRVERSSARLSRS